MSNSFYIIPPSLFDKGLDITLENEYLPNKDYDSTTLLDNVVKEETNSSILSITDREKKEYVNTFIINNSTQKIKLFLEDKRNSFNLNLPTLSPTFEFFGYSNNTEFSSVAFRNSYLQMTLYDRPSLDGIVLSNSIIPAFLFDVNTGVTRTTIYSSTLGDSIQNLQIPRYISDNNISTVYIKYTFHDSKSGRIVKLAPLNENIYPLISGDVRENTLSFNSYKTSDEFIPISLDNINCTYNLEDINLMQVIIDQQIPSTPPPPPPDDDDDDEQEEPFVPVTSTTATVFSTRRGELEFDGSRPVSVQNDQGGVPITEEGTEILLSGLFNDEDTVYMVPLYIVLSRALTISTEITITPSFGSLFVNTEGNYAFIYSDKTYSDSYSTQIKLSSDSFIPEDFPTRLTYNIKKDTIIDENNTFRNPSLYDGKPSIFSVTVTIPSGITTINLNYFGIANFNDEVEIQYSNGCGQFGNEEFTEFRRESVVGTLTIQGSQNIEISPSNTVRMKVVSEGYDFDDCF